MSAPQTNIENQKKRHKPALGGMAISVIGALILLAVFVTWTVWKGGEPEGADAQVDGRTGDVEQVEPTVSN